MKNEHIVYAYGERGDGAGKVVIIGLTDSGLEYLKANPGHTLIVNAPGSGFENVTQFAVYSEKDKETLKRTLRSTGVVVHDAHRG